jgi:hypothetical protein
LSDEEVTLCKIVYDHVISVQQPQTDAERGHMAAGLSSRSNMGPKMSMLC